MFGASSLSSAAHIVELTACPSENYEEMKAGAPVFKFRISTPPPPTFRTQRSVCLGRHLSARLYVIS